MAYQYGYGILEDQLIDLFRSGKPDFAAADRLLVQGANLNAYADDPYDNILSEILCGYWQSAMPENRPDECENCHKDRCNGCVHSMNPDCGESMLEIIRYFLAHGFDVCQRDGQYGAQCLYAIVLSTFDENMIKALKLLLDAGAQNVASADGEDTPWDCTGTEGSFQDTCECNHHLGNLYEAMYQIYRAVEDGRPYQGINSYTAAIGKRIIKVLTEQPESGHVFFDLKLPESSHKNCYQQTLYFVYDTGVLITTQYADFWTDTILPDNTLVDVSSAFPDIVGNTIQSFTYSHHEVRHGTQGYGQPITTITMDNGVKVTFTINFGEVADDKDRVAYYSLSPMPSKWNMFVRKCRSILTQGR